ncbi:MAG TPA: hypothetical protein PKK23_20620, partial [Nitrospirales bacterium]|nr:hypothetical protein [Nitrospirales bacterium]
SGFIRVSFSTRNLSPIGEIGPIRSQPVIAKLCVRNGSRGECGTVRFLIAGQTMRLVDIHWCVAQT